MRIRTQPGERLAQRGGERVRLLDVADVAAGEPDQRHAEALGDDHAATARVVRTAPRAGLKAGPQNRETDWGELP